ncbi:MauE/DoxX family redox-associated membrane protein [Mucilaginibacter sp.]|uniref:MauE/DoxX family redox-associated membrane protein n=1 Tax=Mucilaginibacter sp. TaxID=1882438 RepID=UPI003D109DB8
MKNFLKSLPGTLLAILLIYAAASKLFQYDTFRIQLHKQPLPSGLADILVLAIPALELCCAGLLLSRRLRAWGLFLSLGLLGIFTGYIALVLLHWWSRTPCSCGGILSHLSWTMHLAFNYAFILLNLIAIYIHFEERRAVT